MNLANYISDLLYRYECVIVPKFGGFVTNNKSARIDISRHTLYPPYKQITFNSHLTNNDGLLANYIASVDQISYDCAVNYIQFEIDAWKEKLKNSELTLNGLGTFNLLDGKLHFEPQQKVNYLTSSFGLSNVVRSEIERESAPKVDTVVEAPKVIPVREKKTPNYLKYAAIFVIGLSVIGFSAKYYQDHLYKKQLIEAQNQQDLMEEKIESATFVITKPLPTLNLEVESKKKSFHVIAGAFRFPQNADRKVKQLLKEGYDSRILGVNKWNLTVVSYGSFSTRDEALENLSEIRNNVAKDSWLLIQEF
ncbi:SPOR domain-containing protein [Lutimonas vermicola]|uniref:SPOR domain-containing protein n=1 Tax=Lutimonas vermicola TaxID=414288 RepID=A0ABU9L5F4_9FLAO